MNRTPWMSSLALLALLGCEDSPSVSPSSPDQQVTADAANLDMAADAEPTDMAVMAPDMTVDAAVEVDMAPAVDQGQPPEPDSRAALRAKLLADDYDRFATDDEKVAYAYLKTTFPYLDRDDDLSADFALADGFLDSAEVGPDFLEETSDNRMYQMGRAKAVRELMTRYMAALVQSPDFGPDGVGAELADEALISDQVVMINHIGAANQPLVKRYVTSHPELSTAPRFFNLFQAGSTEYLRDVGYGLFDPAYAESLVSHFNYSVAGHYGMVILARRYDIMGYAYHDCVNRMGVKIVGDVLASDTLHETELVFHAAVLAIADDVISGAHTVEDFANYVASLDEYGELTIESHGARDEGGERVYEARLVRPGSPAKTVNATLRTPLP